MDTDLPTSRHTVRSSLFGCAAISALALLSGLPLSAQEIRRPRSVDEEPSEVRPAREVLPNDADNDVAEGGDGILQADPKSDLLKFANMHFAAGDFQLALEKYSEYLALNPDGPEAREALYNSAEALRKLQLIDLASERYMQLVTRFKAGDYVAESAYKAGAIAYNQRNYEFALPRFKAAEIALVKREDLRELLLDTRYRIARSLQNVGRGGEAIAFLKVVAEAPDPNPFRERVTLALARQTLEANDPAKALEYFNTLINTSKDPALKAEAATRAALIESDLGNSEKADALFTTVLDLEGAEEWKSIAQFGLIRSRYAAKDWDGVVKAYQKGVFKLSDDVRAQMFLMVGNAFQKLGNGDQAIKVYGILENFFKDREEGKEAAYRKLLVYYEADREELIAVADSFIEQLRLTDPASKFIDRALLLKAEHYFAAKEYTKAVAEYDQIRATNISDTYRSAFHYQRAWALANLAQFQAAAAAFSQFLTAAPEDDSRIPTALAKRGDCYKQSGANEQAIADFTTVFTKFPESAEAEFSYQNAGLLHQVEGNTPAMVETFEAMLIAFPETEAAPEAYYWIGRGYYQLKDYTKAVEPLRKARELDPDRYEEIAGSRIVLSFFALKDVDELQKEATTYIKGKERVNLPQQVLAWLAIKLYDRGEVAEAEKFLRVTSTPDEPASTRPLIWKYLGKCRIELKQYDSAVKAIDHYLVSTDQPAAKASALRDKAYALYKLEQYDSAMTNAEEAQALIKQGRINAELWILRGDISRARGKLDEALQFYTIPSQAFVDPEITPLALFRTAQMLQRLGKRDDAIKFTNELRQKYPEWRPPSE